MEEEIKKTKSIHYLVRGDLSWDKSLKLLDEILESDEWWQFLET